MSSKSLKNKAYRRSFVSKLVILENEVIRDIQENMKKVDAAMHPLNTLAEVYEFVEFFKNMLEEFMAKLDVL